MLGMMNSTVTDSVEFYSVSPSTRRAIMERQQQKNKEDGETSAQDCGEDELKVFIEAKDRPQVTYTRDGRKMVGGKLQDGEGQSSTGVADPKQMWDKLIRSKMAANLCASEGNCDKEDEREQKTKVGGGMEIEPTVPITVTSVNPSAAPKAAKANKEISRGRPNP